MRPRKTMAAEMATPVAQGDVAVRGEVAPALATTTSTGLKDMLAPSALATVICGQGVSAVRARRSLASRGPPGAIFLAARRVFFGFSASGTSWSLANGCAPASYAASLGAIMDFGGFIGGALAPLITGFVVQATGSFTPALLVAGAIALASAMAYLVGSRRGDLWPAAVRRVP